MSAITRKQIETVRAMELRYREDAAIDAAHGFASASTNTTKSDALAALLRVVEKVGTMQSSVTRGAGSNHFYCAGRCGANGPDPTKFEHKPTCLEPDRRALAAHGGEAT